jgi:hypothetical protein
VAQRGEGTPGCELVIATGLQNGNDHQIRIREEPLLGFNAGSFSGAGNRPEVLIAGKAAQVIHADARQSHHFIFSEYLLAGLNSHHFRDLTSIDAETKVKAVPVPCNSPSVLLERVRREGERPEPVIIQGFDVGTGEIAPNPTIPIFWSKLEIRV